MKYKFHPNSSVPGALRSRLEQIYKLIDERDLKDARYSDCGEYLHYFYCDGLAIADSLGFDIGIGPHLITTYSDRSGPSYLRWVGNSTSERTLRKFYRFKGVNARLNREPRNYITYKGWPYKAASYLRGYNDLGRSYPPDGSENEPLDIPLNQLWDELDDLLAAWIASYTAKLDKRRAEKILG